MKKLKLTLLLFAYIFTSSVQAQQAIDLLKNDDMFKNAHLGFSLIDVNESNEVLSINSSQFFYPASVQKLITTNLGLILIGKDFKYETKVSISGKIENDTLKGNVIIDATGDPTLNSKRFNNDFLAELIKHLNNENIKIVKGQILLKGKQNDEAIPQTWLYEDVANYYAALPQLFNYKDNSFSISFNSGSDNTTPKINKITPKVPYSFENALKSSAHIQGDQAYILGTPFSIERKIVGTIPALKERFSIKGANAHPLFSFSADLNKEIPILNKEIQHNNSTHLFTHNSVKLSEIAKQCNVYSDNFLAESILNTIGSSSHYDYNTTSGIKALENFIAISKLNQKQVIIKDGSGLSRMNAITPHFMNDFLCTFYPHKDFVASIPVSGKSGTMKAFNSSSLTGKIIAKSGSATGVISYAGYIKANNGKTYAFSLFINHFYESKYQAKQKIARFFEALLEFND